MIVEQHHWTMWGGWQSPPSAGSDGPQLVLAFGSTAALEQGEALADLAAAHPGAVIAGCSTAGEIHGEAVTDDGVVATTVRFGATRVTSASLAITETGGDARAAGVRLVAALPGEDLRHVLVFSDGLAVNGSELTRGIESALPPGVAVTGGLAGDGSRFARTLVIDGADAAPGRVVAVGLHGDALRVGTGSLGGWDPFGPERRVTSSDGNVLRELDGRSALGLYERYLGDHAARLPASGLLFPLSVQTDDGDEVVRTLLAVDREAETMTFAGDLPEGARARLMHANPDRLVDGALGAARAAAAGAVDSPALALLVSCVGRRLVLGQRVEEEVEIIGEALGGSAVLAGFYSYGEIAPAESGRCEMHNQTMTVTTLSEA